MDLSSAADDVESREFQSASPGASDNDFDQEDDSMMIATEISQVKNGNGGKPVSNAKDPNRPRRKKARRACFACQRAHLTCGMYLSCLTTSF